MQVSLEACSVDGEEAIDQSEELHHTLVLTEIFMTYSQRERKGG